MRAYCRNRTYHPLWAYTCPLPRPSTPTHKCSKSVSHQCAACESRVRARPHRTTARHVATRQETSPPTLSKRNGFIYLVLFYRIGYIRPGGTTQLNATSQVDIVNPVLHTTPAIGRAWDCRFRSPHQSPCSASMPMSMRITHSRAAHRGGRAAEHGLREARARTTARAKVGG